MINISAKDKDSTKKRTSGLYCQISKWFKNKFSDKGLLIRNIEFSDCCCTLHADTHSQSCSCPNCGRLCYHVHKYYIRTLESLELFNLQVVIQVRVRYYNCDYPDCPQRTFSGSLAIAGPNARKTHEVQQRILKTSLYLSGRKASLLLKSQNIHASTSGCTRVVKRLGESNPPCTSTRIGIDDFASKKGHVYKCVACDQDTGFPVAIFDCRYGEELNQWMQENQQIELVTRDGSHDYARAISTHLPRAIQVTDRFHLVKNLLKGMTEFIQKTLYQTNEKLSYPYPSLEEAYDYMFKDLCDIGEKRHRERINNYLKIKQMTIEGATRPEILAAIGKSATYVRNLLQGKGLSVHLNTNQRKAMKYLSEMAKIVSDGIISTATLVKRMEGKLDSYLVSRLMRTITEVYTKKRKEIREHNEKLKKSKFKKKVKVALIREFLLKGKTKDEKFDLKMKSNEAIAHAVDLCIDFRKILKGVEADTTLDEWMKKAKKAKCKAIAKFAANIEDDKQAVKAASQTEYSNALLEGTVNRIKCIKRTMYNRAGIELLRAKVIYGL